MGEVLDLSEKVERTLKGIVDDLREAWGEGLKSVILYGSGASGEYIPAESNLNLLVVVRSLSYDDLKRTLRVVKRRLGRGIVVPLFLTEEEVERSSDVFPMEFLEMKENHKVLLGKDVFASLEVGLQNLRLQCELSLKGHLIRLRQVFLESELKSALLRRILKDSLVTLIPILKGMMRLRGVLPPSKKEDVIRLAPKQFDIDGEILSKLWRLKRNELRPKGGELGNLFSKYLAEIDKLAKVVDTWEV
ncbi:MAG: hypothetical protein ACUVXI_08685 [bacterium]